MLSEIDPTCDTVLPFDGVIVGVAGGIFNSGPPEQRARLMDVARRAQTEEPALSVQPVMPDPPLAPRPAAPFTAQALTIYYPFDSDRGSGPDMAQLMRLTQYAVAAKATVTLVSRQGVSRLSHGLPLAERSGTAKRRSDKLAQIMFGLGLPPSGLRSVVIEAASLATGEEDWRQRRIDVSVTPP